MKGVDLNIFFNDNGTEARRPINISDLDYASGGSDNNGHDDGCGCDSDGTDCEGHGDDDDDDHGGGGDWKNRPKVIERQLISPSRVYLCSRQRLVWWLTF